MTEQIRAMRRLWPGFRIVDTGPSYRIVWRGKLAPLHQSYEIAVAYGLPRRLSLTDCVHRTIHGTPEFDLCRRLPIVRVLSPRLELRPDAIDEPPLPHVYLDRHIPHLSPLCLFDPATDEWTRDDLLAETTIPWAAQWIACYEGWLATGRWHGGGRPVRSVIEHG